MNYEYDNTKRHFIIGSICVILLISGVVACLMLRSKNNNDVAEIERRLSSTSNTEVNQESESASTEMGKSVEEAENELNTAKEENIFDDNTETNEAKNTVATSTKTNDNKKEDKKEETKKDSKKDNEEKKETKEVKFIAPLKGEIIREFANDSLVYSKTLEEWITHNGIDIKADKTSVVGAAAEGTVFAIKNDPRYGLTVIINHDNGYQTVYSNLLTAEFVVEGEKVEAGQTIGTVGNSATFEIGDDYHLHFEVLKDNKAIAPVF